MDDQPLSSTLLSDQAYTKLREAIISGDLAQGERLVELEIARRFKVSQAPIRDAIRRLAYEGLATYVPRRGTYVSEISEKDSDDARVVRTVLEGLSGQIVAGNLSADVERTLQTCIEDMDRALKSGHFEIFRELDLSFHRTVCGATGNVFLPKLWQLMEPSMRSLFAIADPRYSGSNDDLVQLHRSLLDLLRGDDKEAASAAFAAHGTRDDVGGAPRDAGKASGPSGNPRQHPGHEQSNATVVEAEAGPGPAARSPQVKPRSVARVAGRSARRSR